MSASDGCIICSCSHSSSDEKFLVLEPEQANVQAATVAPVACAYQGNFAMQSLKHEPKSACDDEARRRNIKPTRREEDLVIAISLSLSLSIYVTKLVADDDDDDGDEEEEHAGSYL